MSERPLEYDADDTATSYQHALLSLHAHAGTYGDRKPADVPGFTPRPPHEELGVLAAAGAQDVSVSMRLDLLYRLAQHGFADDTATGQEYENLAASVLPGRNLELGQLMSDLRASSNDGSAFDQTESARHFKHHETAFIGQDVCTVKTVRVNGIASTWIYAEFETNADFRDLAGWVDPHQWSSWGPSFFRKMEFVGEPDPAKLPVDLTTPPGDEHWHGVFHEQVQLLRRLNTLLHCDYWCQEDKAVGMTYDLDISLDGEIDVDRGYLLVQSLGGDKKRVKALKVVGFTRPEWDALAQFVCPVWTDLVRQAVASATSSSVTPPTQVPPSSSPLVDTFGAWVDFLGASASTYLQLFDDTSDRVRSRSYSSADLLDDGRRYWSQLAKDWAKAWSHGMETVSEVAEHGIDAGFTPPGVPHEVGRGAASALTTSRPTGPSAAGPTEPFAAGQAAAGVAATGPSAAGLVGRERSLVPVPALAQTDVPVVSDLVSIDAGGAVIAAAEITVSVHALTGGTPAIHLHTTNTSAPAGLYVGTVVSPAGLTGTPVQLYVSRATEV